MDRRLSVKLIGATLAASLSNADYSRALARDVRRQPNIVVIVVDDLRCDEFGAGGHPYLLTPEIDRLAREGARFSSAIHSTPLCSPNRACLLTGQYTATHGIYNNADRSLLSHELMTFPRVLKKAGYNTGFVGKWHMGNDPTPRPGFNYWVSFRGQGKSVDPDLYADGRMQKARGYVTDILTDRAIAFLLGTRTSKAPFLLYFAHKAVHPEAVQRDDGSIDMAYGMEYVPADRHRGRYRGRTFPRRTKPTEGGRIGSAMIERYLSRKYSKENVNEFGAILDPGTSEASIQSRAEMMLSVDESVGRVYSALVDIGKIDNTIFVFTSDNGFFFGEHGLSIERRFPYEDAIRSPLLIRYPPLVKAGSTVHELVSSIDLAPSLLELAMVEPESHMQGKSFASHLKSDEQRPAPHRSSVMVEHFSNDQPLPWLLDLDYKAVRTDRYKFIHWVRYPELDELYDLRIDPSESVNRINDPSFGEVAVHLRSELALQVRRSISL